MATLSKNEARFFAKNGGVLTDLPVMVLWSGPQFEVEGLIRSANAPPLIVSHDDRPIARAYMTALLNREIIRPKLASTVPGWLSDLLGEAVEAWDYAARLLVFMEWGFNQNTPDRERIETGIRCQSQSMVAANRAIIDTLSRKPYPHEWVFDGRSGLEAVKSFPEHGVLVHAVRDVAMPSCATELLSMYDASEHPKPMSADDYRAFLDLVTSRPHILFLDDACGIDPPVGDGIVINDMAEQSIATTNLDDVHPSFYHDENRLWKWNTLRDRKTLKVARSRMMETRRAEQKARATGPSHPASKQRGAAMAPNSMPS